MIKKILMSVVLLFSVIVVPSLLVFLNNELVAEATSTKITLKTVTSKQTVVVRDKANNNEKN